MSKKQRVITREALVAVRLMGGVFVKRTGLGKLHFVCPLCEKRRKRKFVSGWVYCPECAEWFEVISII